MTFKPGDLTRLKTGGPTLVVGHVYDKLNAVDVYYVTSTYEVKAIYLPMWVLAPVEEVQACRYTR